MSLTALELLQVSEDALKEAQAAVAQALQVDRQHGTYSTSNAEAFTKGLADPEVNRKADADIKELAENVKTIRADFQQVYPQLASADTFAAALSGGSYTPISPKWKDIYEVSGHADVLVTLGSTFYSGLTAPYRRVCSWHHWLWIHSIVCYAITPLAHALISL